MTKVQFKLRLTQGQHESLKSMLLKGDGRESVVLLLCGRRHGDWADCLMVREVIPVPESAVVRREPNRIEWRTDFLPPILDRADREKWSVLKIHSHPGGYKGFSSLDDDSDRALMSALYDGWLPDGRHGSAVMTPDGSILARVFLPDSGFRPMTSTMIVGSDLWLQQEQEGSDNSASEIAASQTQVFGETTFSMMKGLSAAVVGCSGTGSLVAEQLMRLGIGRLVLVDPERVAKRNLNRIPNATLEDARRERHKTAVLAQTYQRVGLGTKVVTVEEVITSTRAVREIAQCDVAFGCVDSYEGRHVLNRLATYYSIPYFDVGVRLQTDGMGGIDLICGSTHYLSPGGSSLLSRGVVSLEQIQAEALQRTSPAEYERRVREGYLRGVVGHRPAVISVNMAQAGLCVTEFLLRIHRVSFRYRENRLLDWQCLDYSEPELTFPASGEPCPTLSHHVGKGDRTPLLDMPALSE